MAAATMSIRQQQVARVLLAELSDILARDLSDPRLGFVTLIEAEPSRDLRHARIYVSVLGEGKDKRAAMDALEGARGYIRSLLGQRLTMKFIPELTFRLDDTAERAARMEALFHRLAHQPQAAQDPGDPSHRQDAGGDSQGDAEDATTGDP